MRITNQVHVGKDGISRTKVIYSLDERQAMFDRTGLTPPTSAWLETSEILQREKEQGE